MRTIRFLRVVTAAAALSIALLAPSAAEAAKVKIGGGSTIRVDDSGIGAIKLSNPNRTNARGTLTLKSGGVQIGRSSFSIRARRSKNVNVRVVAPAALIALAVGEDVPVDAYATATGKGTSRKTLTFTYPGASGGDPSAGGITEPPPTNAIPDGSVYRGTTDQGETFEFTVTGGAVDPESFYVTGTCFSTRDSSTSFLSGYLRPTGVTFPLGGDGRFAGEGTGDGSSNLSSVTGMRYTIAGQVAGSSAQGTFSLIWETVGFTTYPAASTWQVFCNREVTWTAERQ